jgi:hypothetical protein
MAPAARRPATRVSGVDQMLIVILIWLVTAWVFYMLVKAAVRNGILEADDARARRARLAEAAAFAKQSELEHRNGAPGEQR